jgi:hypothetical protein
MMGAFQSSALALHERGLAVLPTGGDDGKSPLVKGWTTWRGQARRSVESLASKFPDANVGVITGLSRLTVIDADDERALADAERRFGRSPIVTRSPRGGGHLYFRSSGERNANLRSAGLNVDVRGVGGMVLAPPSARAGIGSYRLERGGWDDLARLPALRPDALPGAHRPRTSVSVDAREGERNTKLFTALRCVAEACRSLDDLLTEAHAINAQFAPALSNIEAAKVARSVWTMKEQGRLILPGKPRILMLPAELEGLSADAFYFSAWLKRWHGAKQGASFALSAKAMERARVLAGWGRRRYELAILELRRSGRIERTHRGGSRPGDPSLFRLKVAR